VQLPDSYFPTDPARAIAPVPHDIKEGRAEAGLPAEGFVFCCFNSAAKLTAPVFDIWMRLLTAVPGSVLWLKQPIAAAERNLRREAERRGVDPQRLIFAADAALPIHLARHRLANLFLDTLPYGAHATASDALGAGLPVLTLRGESFAGRVAASLLTALEMPELIAETPQAYEGEALRLARDPAALQALKEKLAQKVRTAPLFDADRFRRHFEEALTAMRR
jgi:predicted O-linked N-acetylglucosamine transferase (SPINDLY family)